MIVLYNICQILILALFWPLLLALVLFKAKYRTSLPARLGRGLESRLPAERAKGKTVWIHALSVGEVSSARPLVIGLRREFPDIRIVFSATTATGRKTAKVLLHKHVDAIVPFPLDLRPVITSYLRLIRPDLFILVETDFWLNILTMLEKSGIPSILVNGRTSARSFSRYRRTRFLSQRLFRSFTHLCMQTDTDRNNMERLGVPPGRLHCLGNLKFDAFPKTAGSDHHPSVQVPPGSLIFLAGSTHEGEEDIIFSVYAELKNRYSALFLIVAPRNPQRCDELSQGAIRHHLVSTLRSGNSTASTDVLIVDTMGELPWLYAQADIAFVGGSMTDEGGHNPIEPAAQGVPVLFGRHMEDFAEISRDLLLAGGALTVTDRASLAEIVETLITDEKQRKAMGRQALGFIERHRGVVDRHLQIIRPYL